MSRIEHLRIFAKSKVVILNYDNISKKFWADLSRKYYPKNAGPIFDQDLPNEKMFSEAI